jgi:hypothetical protein
MEYQNKSASIQELAKALCEFQKNIRDVQKDAHAHKHDYATLGAILALARPLWTEHGFSVLQLGVDHATEESIIVLETMLLHVSGQWISSRFRFKVPPLKNYAQDAGLIISYMRRYSLAALLGITQVDNDAEIETKGSSDKKKREMVDIETGEVYKMLVSPETVSQLRIEMQKKGDEIQGKMYEWLGKQGKDRLEELTESQAKECLVRLRSV